MKLKLELPSLKKLISPDRITFLFLIVFPLPFLYFLFQFYVQIQELQSMEEQMERLRVKAASLQFQKEKESSFLTLIKQADRFYIDKHLESFVLLEPEIKRLRALSHQLEETDPAKKRLQLLEEKNRLLFAEEQIRRSETIQEVEEKLQAAVELDDEDLKKLLAIIEGTPIPPYAAPPQRPQMIIKNFDLTKKTVAPQENVFVLNMQLIKRESLHND